MNQTRQLLNKLRVAKPESIITKIAKFQEYLLKVNKQINLVSRKNSADVIYDLTMDSLTILEFIKYDSYSTLLDIGSGNGFPGIIHKIVNPDLKLISVDSNQRKIQFQKEAVRLLELEDCCFIAERAENITPLNGDYMIAKAVGDINLLIELAGLHLKKNGVLLVPSSLNKIYQASNKFDFELQDDITYSYQVKRGVNKSCKLLLFKNIR